MELKNYHGEILAKAELNGMWVIKIFSEDEGRAYTFVVRKEDVNCDLVEGLYITATPADAMGLTCSYVDEWGRHCSYCGKHMTEGYYVHEHLYACSDECASALCGGEKAFRESILLDEDGELAEDSPTYWTEWE